MHAEKPQTRQGDYTEVASIYNKWMNKTNRISPRFLLVLAALAIALVWHLPYGQLALYPFSLLATYAHEMGHGLTALLVGEQFDRIALYADGSGIAYWHGQPSRLAMALVAAGGLLGPTIAGTSLLVLARSPRHARILLAAVAAFMVLTVILWARNTFAVAFLLTMAALFAVGARMLPDFAAAFALQCIAALLCLAWYRDLDYMFSNQAVVDGVARPSDTALIAQSLALPYWFWGGVVALASLALLALGVWKTGWGNGASK